MIDPMSRANNPQMGDDFAAVYEATARRITGPVSKTVLDIVGVGRALRMSDHGTARRWLSFYPRRGPRQRRSLLYRGQCQAPA